MGVKDLWSVLTPYAERKPICELRGKVVAIDLAGWVCESLNVVDYFVHPRHHLKNLFFRTCYLIWEEVTPVFVLEGEAPKLKNQVIAKRNQLQFRGVKPKEKASTESQGTIALQPAKDKGRTRFNHVLKQCEMLLQALGIQCVQGPGEAEAYCAFLNKKGLVDGVISQDSDCFAYGAIRVYRNFSISSQGAQAAQGGAVDIYDIRQICESLDFAQNKVIAMALLCGCDYCPEGVGGVGRDGVLKLFNKYADKNILERMRSWRREDDKYTALEMKVDDKTICSNCGHLGRTQSHTKNGCGVCRTNHGCDDTLWKEERLALKAELAIRKKAMSDNAFPSEEIIHEFLTEPATLPNLILTWKQPNIVKFVKKIGNLLEWPEIYCFQKCLPILTRWQVRNSLLLRLSPATAFVEPKEIVKKRTLKGVPSLELIWADRQEFFKGLIPHEQLNNFEKANPKGLQDLWTTIEPLNLLEQAYPEMVEAFIKSKEKPKKAKRTTKAKQKTELAHDMPLGSLENLKDLIEATTDIAKSIKPKRTKTISVKGTKTVSQPIRNFFKENLTETPPKSKKINLATKSSTPITKCFPSDLESDCDDIFNVSDIIKGIVKGSVGSQLTTHAGRILHYDPFSSDFSMRLNEHSLDDLYLVAQKRSLSRSHLQENCVAKRVSLDDSYYFSSTNHEISHLKPLRDNMKTLESAMLHTHVERFKQINGLTPTPKLQSFSTDCDSCAIEDKNASYFFNQSARNEQEDEFEKFLEMSFGRISPQSHTNSSCVLISSDSDYNIDDK